MPSSLSSSTALLLLVADKQFRDFLVNFLESQEYPPRVVGTPNEALQTLKGQDQALVFVDCTTVSAYGPGLYAKMKVACPRCRIVLLCDKSHHEHRDIVKEAMDLGIYACLLAPFADWEVLAMVRHSQVAKPSGRRQARTREKQ
jgi:DNA-binding NtrC family response regulator